MCKIIRDTVEEYTLCVFLCLDQLSNKHKSNFKVIIPVCTSLS